MIISSLWQAIGNTPLLHLPLRGGDVHLYIKLEQLNPCGSMKDRMALSMLNDLEFRHELAPGAKIVESSSGNTASALAMLCAARGYEFTALMDNHSSKSKRLAVSAVGGKVMVIASDGGGLVTALRDEEAERLSAQQDTYWTEQHNNPANSWGYEALAKELMDDLGTDIDYFVSAIGTGGSLCGTASCLKQNIPGLIAIGVEPEGSVIFGPPGHDYLQSGTGTPDAATVGLVIDYDVIDLGKKVSDRHAFATCRVLATRLGVLVGGSAGGAIYEALKIAADAVKGSKIVTIACDAGSKYTDTIFDDEWLSKQGINLSAEVADVQNLLSSRNYCHNDIRQTRIGSPVQ
jgi:cystathionine beta-synthase